MIVTSVRQCVKAPHSSALGWASQWEIIVKKYIRDWSRDEQFSQKERKQNLPKEVTKNVSITRP